jgi:adenylate cyclase class 2
MREIEIKARVGELGRIRVALQQQGVELTETVRHHDVVWGVLGEPSGSGAPWLRLRTESAGGAVRHLLTFKRSAAAGRQLDSIEYETEVDSPEVVVGMIGELGFTLYSDITKTRQKAQVGDIEICLDSVDGLGDFIEAEKLTSDDANYDQVAEELWLLLEGMGVTRKDEVTDGYDVLVNKNLGKEWV